MQKLNLKKYITYGLYPTLLCSIMFIVFLSIKWRLNYSIVYGSIVTFLVIVLVLAEYFFPMKEEWGMTAHNFKRDVKYILLDAPIVAITKKGFGVFAIWYSQNYEGYFSKSSIIVSSLVYLLVFEFFQYWYHRFSHIGKGRIGAFFWRIHAAHHLPNKVYVMMHAVFNPINAVLTIILTQFPLILLGISPESTLIVTLLISFQSLISHFNVDIKAGFLNYIFIGTETHRYHHSVNIQEAQNFGNTLAFWDIVFGTFYYQPEKFPDALGIDNPAEYPKSEDIFDVIKLPFKQ